jgi:hypothetical protein
MGAGKPIHVVGPADEGTIELADVVQGPSAHEHGPELASRLAPDEPFRLAPRRSGVALLDAELDLAADVAKGGIGVQGVDLGLETSW